MLGDEGFNVATVERVREALAQWDAAKPYPRRRDITAQIACVAHYLVCDRGYTRKDRCCGTRERRAHDEWRRLVR
jgi:hypothetical protein